MKISIVIAVFNGEEYIKESVESILNQTYSEFELIIVNDGSKDKTKDIINSYSDPRVRIIHLTKNAGAAKALNIGIAESKGDWIAIQDADDISIPTRIEQQVKYINEHPDVVAVGSLIECIPGKNSYNLANLQHEAIYKNRFITREQIKQELFHGCCLCHGSVIFSKSAYSRAGGYDPRYKIAYDWDLWLRLCRVGPIEVVPIVLYKYRIYPNSLSHKDERKTWSETVVITTRAIQRLRLGKARRNARIIVLGPKYGASNFQKIVNKKCSIQVRKRLEDCSKKNLLKVYQDYKNGKVDWVIVLDGPGAGKSQRFLMKKGMKLTNNLFRFSYG